MTANVDEAKFAAIAVEFGMLAADGFVVEIDVAGGMTAGGGGRLGEQKSRTGVRSAFDYHHSSTAWQPFRGVHRRHVSPPLPRWGTDATRFVRFTAHEAVLLALIEKVGVFEQPTRQHLDQRTGRRRHRSRSHR